MKVLFIGGTGVISTACTRAALAAGIDLTLLCRGKTIGLQKSGARILQGDIRDAAWARQALGGRDFDVVVEWVGFVPAHVDLDMELFRGRTQQYIFISSASVYQVPVPSLPITESTPQINPHFSYPRDKIACEKRLFDAFRSERFPVTIVRPSHTYDARLLPIRGGWTAVDRMRRGLPVVVPGTGATLWTLTHNEDFARGLVGLFGLQASLGEAVHITSDESMTWDAIYDAIAQAAGATLRAVHVPNDTIAAIDPEWGASLLGDKAYSKVFDNSKIKRLVPGYHAAIPYSRGAAEQIAWYEADPARRVVDEAFNAKVDSLLELPGVT
jgi:nucleoside-diphosphate-sugar epimerase